MKHKETSPSVKLFLPREVWGSLVSVLGYFIETEKEIGATFFSKYSSQLLSKILKHGRPYKEDDSDRAAIYFFTNEAGVLLKLLSFYVSLGEQPKEDFFKMLLENQQRKNRS